MTHTAKRLALVLALVIAAIPLSAYKPYTRTPVDVVCDSQSIAPAAVYTSAAVKIGQSEIQAIDWVITGTPNLNVIVLQSNAEAGPYNKWSGTSLAGTTVTNDVTITTAAGGTDLRLVPSMWAKYQFTNSHNSTITALVRGFHQ